VAASRAARCRGNKDPAGGVGLILSVGAVRTLKGDKQVEGGGRIASGRTSRGSSTTSSCWWCICASPGAHRPAVLGGGDGA
jgi:hypothetical protein